MTPARPLPRVPAPPAGPAQGGFAMIAALLAMLMVTGLASASLLYSQMDMAVAGNYRTQRTAEVAADGGLELLRAMLYSNEPMLNLPISVPATSTAARAWVSNVAYQDADIAVAMQVRYKQEDNINFNGAETYPDEVVRYGKDYNFLNAQKDVGKQPVYTVSITDTRTGTKAEADLIAALGFRTPAAIFVRGKAKMYKWGNATQERQEVTAGTGFPALATTLSQSTSNVFIQTATSVHGSMTPNRANPLAHNDLFHNSSASPPWGNLTTCYTHNSYSDQSGGVGYYDRPSQYYANTVGSGGSHSSHASPLVPPWPTGATGLSNVAPLYNYDFDDVYTETENANAYNAGQRNLARDRQFILLGVGDKTLDLDAAPSAAAAKAIFNFDKSDGAVVRYNYAMPAPGSGTCPADWGALECMMGAQFTDFRDVADVVLTGDQTITVPDDVGGTYTTTGGLDMGGLTYGTADAPQIVFFESNMNDDGTANGSDPLALVTNTGTQMGGFGILVINGDARIFGSINWRGLMLVRGDLFFRPWQGGNWCNRSDNTLRSNWDGFIVIGGDLDMLTLAGGTLLLGYGGPNSSAADIKGIISKAIPSKVLAWRRSYE